VIVALAVFAWGTELDCPPGAEAMHVDDATWCVVDGLPHGPLVVTRGTQTVWTGTFDRGIPTERWSMYNRDGELVARSPVSADVLVGCTLEAPDCWVKAVDKQLRLVLSEGKRMVSSTLRYQRNGGRLVRSGDDFVIDFWSIWSVRAPDARLGWGLQQGRSEFYRDGRIQLRAEHGESGWLDGVLAVFDRHGRPQRRAHFATGLLDGVEETWYPNGQRRNLVTWRQGALHGEVSWFDEDGQQVVQGTFSRGEPCSSFTMRDRVSKKYPICRL
jgi:hypothetical protein